VWLLALLGLIAGCESRSRLVVQVRSDLVPVRDFSRVAVTVTPAGSAAELSLAADATTEWGRGVRGGEVELPPGRYALDIRAEDAGGRPVVTRPVRVELSDGVQVVTVLLTADCAGVECPASGDDASLVACLAGRCVEEGCTEETPGACGTPECGDDGDCDAPAGSCARAVCTASGVCLAEPDHAACAPQVCAVEGGCVDPGGGGGECVPVAPTPWIALGTEPVGVAVAALPETAQWITAIDDSETAVAMSVASLDGRIDLASTPVAASVGAWGLAIVAVDGPELAMIAHRHSGRNRTDGILIGPDGSPRTLPGPTRQLIRPGSGVSLGGEPTFLMNDRDGMGGSAFSLYRYSVGGIINRVAAIGPYTTVTNAWIGPKPDGGALVAIPNPEGSMDHCDLVVIDPGGAELATVPIPTDGTCRRAAAAELDDGSLVVAYVDDGGIGLQRFGADLSLEGSAVDLPITGGAQLLEVWAGTRSSFRIVWDTDGAVEAARVGRANDFGRAERFATPSPGLSRAARQGPALAIAFHDGSAWMLTVVCDG